MHDIISDIKKGDKAAFREFFENYYPILCSFAMKYLADKELSKDTAQDVLLKYWETRADFSSVSEVRGFLYAATKNKCINHLKKNEINLRYVQETLAADEGILFEENVMEHEITLLLHQAVDALPAQMRNIIKLSMQGARNADVAEQLGIAAGTVHTLKKMAYKKLRENLRNHFYLMLFF